MTKKNNLLAVISCAFAVALAAAVPAGSAGEAGSCGAKMAGEGCSATAKVAKAEKAAGGCPMSAKMASQTPDQGEAKISRAVLTAADAPKSGSACSMSKSAETASACSVEKSAKMASACSAEKPAEMAAACSMEKPAKMAAGYECDKADCDMAGKKVDMAGKACGAQKGLMALYISNEGEWYLNSWKVQPEELKKKLAAGLKENPETRLSLKVEEGTPDDQVQALLGFLKAQEIQSVSVQKDDAEPSEVKLTQVTGS
jgi:hypothetical protein